MFAGSVYDHSTSLQKQPPRGVLEKKVFRKYAANLQELQSKFIETALRHGCCPVNLLHIFRTPFPGNTSGWLLFSLIEIKSKDVFDDIFTKTFF